MKMSSFSTGVSIQYPRNRSAATIASHHLSNQVEYPFTFPTNSPTSSEPQYRSDTESYNVFQELAYHYSYERIRQLIKELLRRNNDTSYSQVLRFFLQYCPRIESGAAVAQLSTTTLLSRRRLRDYNAPVLFPEFHAIPTAAIIAGTDATSSNLWVGPLMQKLRRTFSLCLVVPRDVTTARRFIEWLTARLEKLCAMKHKEEHWLEELVDNFDLLPLDMPPVAVENIGRRLTRHEQVKRAGLAGEMAYVNEEDEQNKQMDDICYDLSSESEDSGDDTDFGSSRRGKRKRRQLAPVAYGRWTMSKLLSTVKRDVDELVSPNCDNTCREWVAMLGELVHDRLQEALTRVKKLQKKEMVSQKHCML
ncbi:unnamed protein product [Peronospora destructor]|uniref:Uncharacterized protein n=1 Tax=Peronospora destructor TaxID=86335 RepID=A0AAV0UTH1_9STRA|nr:unnamed protein product [Peronospora destructor]